MSDCSSVIGGGEPSLNELMTLVEGIEGNDPMSVEAAQAIYEGLREFPREMQQRILVLLAKHTHPYGLPVNGGIEEATTPILVPIVKQLLSEDPGEIARANKQLIAVFGKEIAKRYQGAIADAIKRVLGIDAADV